jgi:hypothetical protein
MIDIKQTTFETLIRHGYFEKPTTHTNITSKHVIYDVCKNNNMLMKHNSGFVPFTYIAIDLDTGVINVHDIKKDQIIAVIENAHVLVTIVIKL